MMEVFLPPWCKSKRPFAKAWKPSSMAKVCLIMEANPKHSERHAVYVKLSLTAPNENRPEIRDKLCIYFQSKQGGNCDVEYIRLLGEDANGSWYRVAFDKPSGASHVLSRSDHVIIIDGVKVPLEVQGCPPAPPGTSVSSSAETGKDTERGVTEQNQATSGDETQCQMTSMSGSGDTQKGTSCNAATFNQHEATQQMLSPEKRMKVEPVTQVPTCRAPPGLGNQHLADSSNRRGSADLYGKDEHHQPQDTRFCGPIVPPTSNQAQGNVSDIWTPQGGTMGTNLPLNFQGYQWPIESMTNENIQPQRLLFPNQPLDNQLYEGGAQDFLYRGKQGYQFPGNNQQAGRADTNKQDQLMRRHLGAIVRTSLDGDSVKADGGIKMENLQDDPEEEDEQLIEVTGLKRSTHDEVLKLYFENPLKSGGGEIETMERDPQTGAVRITFKNPSVAAGVERRKHKLLGAFLKVKLITKKKRRPLTVKAQCLFLKGIPDGCSSQYLKLFIEITVCMDEEPMVRYGEKPETALCTFTHDIPDLEAVIRKVSDRKLKGVSVKAEKVHHSDAILVQGVPQNLEMVELYFDNKKSGGGGVTDVQPGPMDGQAIVYFEDWKVVEDVLRKCPHKLGGTELLIESYHDFLGRLSQFDAPTPHIPKPVLVQVEEPIMEFFYGKGKNAKTKLLKELTKVKASLHWPDGSQTSQAKLEPVIDDSQRPSSWLNWNKEAVDVLTDFMKGYKTARVPVPQSLWNDAADIINKMTTTCSMVPDAQHYAVILVGEQQDVDVVKAEINYIIKKFQTAFVPVGGRIQDRFLQVEVPVTPKTPKFTVSGLNVVTKEGMTIKMTKGSIAVETVDVIVNTVGSDMNMASGKVSKAISIAAGPTLQQECDTLRAARGSVSLWSYLETGPGGLTCKKIYHCVCGGYKQQSEQLMKKLVIELMLRASQNSMTSMAIPALGTGTLSYPPAVTARCMYEAAFEFSSQQPHGSLKDVRFVVYDKDMSTIKAFENEIQHLKPSSPAATGGATGGATGTTGTTNKKTFREKKKSTAEIQSWTEDDQEEEEHQEMVIQQLFQNKFEDFPDPMGLIDKMTEKHFAELKQIGKKHNVTVEPTKGHVKVIRVEGCNFNVKDALLEISQMFTKIQTEENKKQKIKHLAKKVKWNYSTPSGTDDYDEEINAMLEEAYQKKKPSITLDLKKGRAIIDFQKMQQTSKSGVSNVCRNDLKSATRFERPSNWILMKQDELTKMVKLTAGTKEYRAVETKFRVSPMSGFNGIVEIQRVQNQALLMQFQARKAALQIRLKRSDVEKVLYHGTDEETCNNICRHGFDRGFCGKNASVYGNGTYFAVQAGYSARSQYAKSNANGVMHILASKVLVGDYIRGSQGMITPPKKPQSPGELFDSVVDNMNAPAIHVIFHDAQAYPEYLIKFQLQETS